MNTYVGITLSLLVHFTVALVLSANLPSERLDFGQESGPIIVRLQNDGPTIQRKTNLKKKAALPKKTKSILPKGFDDQIKTFISPEYPVFAIRKSIEGKVLLNLKINKKGEVHEVLIISSSGHSLLDDSAKAAAKKWRFKSLEKETTLEKEIIFKLR